MESVSSELLDRQARAFKVLLFDLLESNGQIPRKNSQEDDRAAAHRLQSPLHPFDASKICVKRMNRLQKGKTWPLIVTLPTSADAIALLKNQSLLNDPYYIKQNLTPQQRAYLAEMRVTVLVLNNQGSNKTIKYVDNTQTIVDRDPKTTSACTPDSGIKDSSPTTQVSPVRSIKTLQIRVKWTKSPILDQPNKKTPAQPTFPWQFGNPLPECEWARNISGWVPSSLRHQCGVFNVIILTEMNLHSGIKNNELGLRNFNIFRCGRDLDLLHMDGGDRVSIAIRDSHHACKCRSDKVRVEQLFLQVKVADTRFVVGATIFVSHYV